MRRREGTMRYLYVSVRYARNVREVCENKKDNVADSVNSSEQLCDRWLTGGNRAV